MKYILLFLLISMLSNFGPLYSQGRIYTVSNNPDFNITLSTPFKPIDPTMDANLNITTLINELATQHVVVDDDVFFSYEVAFIEDVIYNSPYNLSVASNNSVLVYAHVINDTSGAINYAGSSTVIVGTEPGWLPAYFPFLLPVYMPPIPREVQTGSRLGHTSVDAGTYAAVLATGIGGQYAQIGLQAPSTTATIQILAGNYLLVQAGGTDAFAKIGFGGVAGTTCDNVDVSIFINIEEGNIWLNGAGERAFAQIGNINECNVQLQGNIDVFARSVFVNTPTNGNIFVNGGTEPDSWARIGHYRNSTDIIPNVDIGGYINVIDSSSVVLKSGMLPFANAAIGHYIDLPHDVPCQLSGAIAIEARHWGVFMDASAGGGSPGNFVHIGHFGRTTGTSMTCQDSVYVNTGGDIYAKSGMDPESFAMFGHRAEALVFPLASGDIELNAGDSIEMVASPGAINHAQVGHVAFGGDAHGNITTRAGNRQIYQTIHSNDPTSYVTIGHDGGNISGNIYMVAFDNIEFHSSQNPNGAAVFVRGVDTVQIISHDSIRAVANETGVEISSLNSNSVTLLKAAKDISLISGNSINGAAINSPQADFIICYSGDDILLSQELLNVSHLDGHILLHADKWFIPNELFPSQFSRTGGIQNLAGNQHLFHDSLGVIKFQGNVDPVVLQTVNGNIDINSKSTSGNGSICDLNISDFGSDKVDFNTVNGTVFVRMKLDVNGLPQEMGDSYENIHIEDWVFGTGKLFIDANTAVNVSNSTLSAPEVLLHTN